MITTSNKVLHIKNNAMLLRLRDYLDSKNLSHDLYFHKLQPEMNYIFIDYGVFKNGSIEPNEEEIEFDEYIELLENDCR